MKFISLFHAVTFISDCIETYPYLNEPHPGRQKIEKDHIGLSKISKAAADAFWNHVNPFREKARRLSWSALPRFSLCWYLSTIIAPLPIAVLYTTSGVFCPND